MKYKDLLKQVLEDVLNSPNVPEEVKKEAYDKCPELKPINSLEKNVWYIDDNGDTTYLFCYVSRHNNYGFFRGEWSTGWSISGKWQGLRVATDNEVEKYLTKEAKKRGYKKGQTLVPMDDTCHDTIIVPEGSKEFHYRLIVGLKPRLRLGYATIFLDGKWAEKGYTKEAAEKIIGGKIVD